MPGTLRPDANCPMCGDPLLGITDETTDARVTREYFHAKVRRAGPVRNSSARRPPCTRSFSDAHKAGAERRGLEVDRGVLV